MRREAHVPRGGPDGGDGGRGGSIYLRVDAGQTALHDFRYKHHFHATPGGRGERQKRHGKAGEDLYLHGEAGPVHITNLESPDPLVESFIEAAAAAGVPRNSDLSGPELEGTGHSPVTIWKGRRWHAARAYLREARKRPNLTIETKALVHRVVVRRWAEPWGSSTSVTGAAAPPARVATWSCRRAPSTRRTCCSSRASGPPTTCASSGSSTLVDSPAVGANLSEHPMTLVNWELAEGQPGLSDATHPKWLLRWLMRRQGQAREQHRRGARARPHARAARGSGLPAPVRARLLLGARRRRAPEAGDGDRRSRTGRRRAGARSSPARATRTSCPRSGSTCSPSARTSRR